MLFRSFFYPFFIFEVHVRFMCLIIQLKGRKKIIKKNDFLIFDFTI